jgi:hypothetical protein
VGKREGRNHLGDLDVDGMIILKLISNKRDTKTWTGFIWLGIYTFGGTCFNGQGDAFRWPLKY